MKFVYFVLFAAFAALCQGQGVQESTELIAGTSPEDSEERSGVVEGQDRRQLWDFLSLLFSLAPRLPHPHPPPQPDSGAHTDGSDGTGDSDTESTTSDGSSSDNSFSSSYSELESGTNSAASNASEQGSGHQIISLLMAIVAAGAVATAMVAVIVGQRSYFRKSHPLKGSVQQRKELFSSFVTTHLSSNAAARPQRTVEMTPQEGVYQNMV